MTYRLSLLAGAALALALGASSAAMAQSAQTSNGMFGSRTIGGGVNARSGTAFGSGGAQGAGGAGQLGPQGQETVGQITGGERFVRGARQPGQFVGADSGDASAFNSIQQAMGMGLGGRQGGLTGGRTTNNPFSQFNSLTRGGQFGNQANQANQQNGRGGNMRGRAPQIPIALRLGFEPPSVPVTQVQTRVERRVERAFKVGPATRVNITVQGRTAVLQGEVATEHEKTLAEKLAMLEPGVSSVQNDLTVASRP